MVPLLYPLIGVSAFLGYKIWEDTDKPSPVTNQCNVPGACPPPAQDTNLEDYLGLAFIAATATALYLFSKK